MLACPDTEKHSRSHQRKPIAPLATGAAVVLCKYLRFIGRSLNVAFVLPDGSLHSELDHQVLDFFSDQRGDGPAIYTLWISDHLSLLSIGFASPGLKALAIRHSFFTDDSFGGLVMRAAVSALGANVLPLSEHNPVARLRLLRSVVEDRPNAFLAVDGRGPYFQVSTGVINLARTIYASIVPCSVISTPALRIPNFRVPVWVPLPRSHVIASFGTARHPRGSMSIAQATDEARNLKAALDELHGNSRISEEPILRRS